MAEPTPEQYEALIGDLEAQLVDYFGLDPAESDTVRDQVVRTLQETLAMAESQRNKNDFLYLQLDLTRDGRSRGAYFPELPTPGALWAYLWGHAHKGEQVTVSVHSGAGRRTVKDVWPFGLDVAEEMTRPVGLGVIGELEDGDLAARIRRLGRWKVAWAINSGPPTWWLPKARIERRREKNAVIFEAGWLRHCLTLVVVRTSGD